MQIQSLVGKNALVTEASSGIGRSVALALAAEGARVVLTGQRMRELQETGAQIERLSGQYLTVVSDITNEQSVKALLPRPLPVGIAWISPSMPPFFFASAPLMKPNWTHSMKCSQPTPWSLVVPQV